MRDIRTIGVKREEAKMDTFGKWGMTTDPRFPHHG